MAGSDFRYSNDSRHSGNYSPAVFLFSGFRNQLNFSSEQYILDNPYPRFFRIFASE
jgi:hypothetical protein